MQINPSKSGVVWAAEEGTVFLPTHGNASRVTLDGVGLTSYEDHSRTPYILGISPEGVQIRLTDWVGSLQFQTEDDAGTTVHPCLVYPAKLAQDEQEAFKAMARMTDAFPHLTQGLGFPDELRPRTDLSRSRPLSTAVLAPFASRAWQLWQEALRLPRPSLGHTRRLVHGGSVPDRVDWEMTLDHWALGGFPGHVARDLKPLGPPVATTAVHELWDALILAAQQSFSPDAGEMLRHLLQVKAGLPERPARPEARSDNLSRAVQQMTAQIQSLVQQAQGLPTGHARMAELYELWAMLTFARALGATEGAFCRGEEGLYQGTLRGDGLTAVLNPKLSFRGIGSSAQNVRPDILVVWDSGEALVADVKYRPVARLPAEKQREINDQVLRYMGLSHARTGLVLWPGRPGEDLWHGQLPGDRARLARLRIHPLDPPSAVRQALKQLILPGEH